MSKTTSQAIPTTRRVTINDAAHMPHDYSTTPGGTLFSTTPGANRDCKQSTKEDVTAPEACDFVGTRIIYDRKFLLDCRSSPLARTPPCCLPDIPGVTSPPSVTRNNDKVRAQQTVNNNSISPPADKSAGEDAQFEMDI